LLGLAVGAVPRAIVVQGGCQVRAESEAFQGQWGCR